MLKKTKRLNRSKLVQSSWNQFGSYYCKLIQESLGNDGKMRCRDGNYWQSRESWYRKTGQNYKSSFII